MLVDSGHFLSDERSTHGELRPDMVTRNEWVTKAFEQFPVDVANLSARELKYFSRFLSRADFARYAQLQPLLNKLVSANAIGASNEVVSLPRFIIKEVALRQNPATRLRAAFIGLTQSTPAAPRGFKFDSLIDAAKRASAEARQRADIVIALAYVTPAEATQLSREVPDIDAIIATNSVGGGVTFTPPITVGKKLIVFATYEATMLGELRFYRDAQANFSIAARYITLDALTPDDPDARRLVDAATSAESEMRASSKKSLEEWYASTGMLGRRGGEPNIETATGYVGSNSCSQCHREQYYQWARSEHARASSPLVAKPFEFETSCLSCHSTGNETNPAARARGLQSVHCEQCHGPGAAHALNPTAGYGKIANLQSACSHCHTPATSPNFELKTAWAVIKH